MSSWLEQLRPASWRGVGFRVDSSEVVSGDQVVVRDYPFGELPVVYRMGESAEHIRLSAYVVGEDYAIQRDALRRVLTGEGELIHPTMGVIKAHVAGPYTMREAPLTQGCVVRFELHFVRAELRASITELASTQADAVLAALATKEAAVANFVGDCERLKDLPGFAVEDVRGKIAASIETAMGPISSAVATVTGTTDAIAGAYQSGRSALNAIVAQPVALASSIRELFDLPSDLAASSRAALRDAYRDLIGASGSTERPSWQQVIQPAAGRIAIFGMGSASALPTTKTATRKAVQRLLTATDRFFDTLALAAWVESLAGDDMASYDQAVVWRGQLYTAVQTLLTAASTDAAAEALPESDWYSSVLTLLNKGSADLQRRGRDQSRVTTWTPTAWMSIWAISYELYGTAKWADEIADMNPDLENPLLVPPGKPLRVARHV